VEIRRVILNLSPSILMSGDPLPQNHKQSIAVKIPSNFLIFFGLSADS
jgi:hypothetical protein